MEDFLNEKFNEFDNFFSISFKESLGYSKAKKNYRKKQKAKSQEFDEASYELDKILSQMGNLEFDFNESDFEEKTERLLNASKNLWSEDDKKEVINLINLYYNLNIKNDIGIIISNKIINNEFFKLLLQIIIFIFSFTFSYWISMKLDFLEINYGKFIGQMLIALIIFLTLEKILDYVKKELHYWRIMKLHFSYGSIIPIIEKAKNILDKNSR